MRVLVVTQYFWPENFRVNDLVGGLAARGHDVTVLTGLPNYPSGRIFPGYGWRGPRRQQYAGATVIRVPLIARGNGNGFRLALNYASFVLFGVWGALFRLRGAYDVIFVSEVSPITVGIPAIFARWRFGAPILFWVLDIWPDTLSAIGVVRSRRALQAISILVRWIYARCARVLVQSQAFVPAVARHGVAESRILYFPNWVEGDYGRAAGALPAHIGPVPHGFRVMFAGNIGAAQDFPAILEAADILRDADVSWLIVGDGRMAEKVRTEVARRGLEHRLHFLGRHPPESMPDFFAAADALLVSLTAEPIFALTVPGKVQSYLASGRPILAMLDGEGARVVTEARAGFSCAAGDSRTLAANVMKLARLTAAEREALGENGRGYAGLHFDRERLFDQLEGWAEEVVLEQRIDPAGTAGAASTRESRKLRG